MLINPDTGNPDTIRNQKMIISEWNTFKEEFLRNNDFIRTKESRQGIEDFLSIFDAQINSHDQLISDMKNRIFFNTFFDRYIIHPLDFEVSQVMNYHSQLFEKIATPLTVTQKIIKETPDIVVFRKAGTANSSINANDIKKQYDEKYKPIIDYQFSEYQVKYDAQIDFNTTMNYIEYADIQMSESVINNVEMDIHCRIRMVQ